MKLIDIKSFLALCEHKKICTASKQLNISQQGLSKRISSIEDEINLSLFTRSRSGVTLTENGKQLVPHFNNLLSEYKKMYKTVDKIKNSCNTIKIGFGHGTTSAIGVNFIQQYLKLNNNIKIETYECYDQECFHSLLNNDVDIAFLVEDFTRTDIDCVKIFEGNPYTIVNKNHAFANDKEALYIEDLHNQPIVLTTTDFNMRKSFDKICRKLNVEPNIIYEGSSVSSYINLSIDMPAISIIVDFMQQYVNSTNVKFLPLLNGPMYKVHIAKNKNCSDIEINKLYSFITDYLSK